MGAKMRVLVCGGRDYKDRDTIYRVLNSLSGASLGDKPNPSWLPRPDLEIISGMARGADSIAEEWAVSNWVMCHRFPAQWDKYGKSAGYKRNAQMLEEGKPDLVVAFPGGKGTQMMVDLARKAGIAVEVIT